MHWLPLIGIAASMCLRDVFGTLVTASVAHGRARLAATFDMVCDAGTYLSVAFGVQQAGGVSVAPVLALVVGGWIGTYTGVLLGNLLERFLGKPLPPPRTRWASSAA